MRTLPSTSISTQISSSEQEQQLSKQKELIDHLERQIAVQRRAMANTQQSYNPGASAVAAPPSGPSSSLEAPTSVLSSQSHNSSFNTNANANDALVPTSSSGMNTNVNIRKNAQLSKLVTKAMGTISIKHTCVPNSHITDIPMDFLFARVRPLIQIHLIKRTSRLKDER